MCGICGFNWKGEKKLKAIADLMNHRGPEQEGYYTDANVSIGHKRLSIIDVSKKGKQPMVNETGDVLITFNGEIYDYNVLRKELVGKGHKFTSKTDTEVIIHAYEEYGHKCLERLNGQFAFCIYDKKKGELFLARDRLGIRPLYYYAEKNSFVFASELKCLLESGVVPKEIDKYSLNHYLMFGYSPRNKSIVKSAKKLDPGNYLVYNIEKKKIVTLEPYWKIKFNTIKSYNEKKIIRTIREKLEESVRLRMVADRPVGAFLSGGLDSSLIVALMSKHTKNLETFSIGFTYEEFDESHYAELVAKKFGTKHHQMKFTSKDIQKLLPELIYYYDEPFADPSAIPTLLLAMVAKKYVTVSLSGTGGDELFAGYKRYQHYAMLRNVLKVPFIKEFTSFASSIGRTEMLDKVRMVFEEPKDYMMYPKLFSYFDKYCLSLDTRVFNDFKKHFSNNNVNDAFCFDQSEYLPNDLLYKEDIACMAHSLEGRFPFLDHNLVEFANSLPIKAKMRGKTVKYLLKKAAEGILPNEVIYRTKQSFSVPFNHYFRKELKDFAYDIIFNFEGYDYYDKIKVKKCWTAHQKNERDYTHLFLTLIVFNLWYGKWMA